jgi:hypothetical protein
VNFDGKSSYFENVNVWHSARVVNRSDRPDLGVQSNRSDECKQLI